MRILVISDIHANLNALDAVLADAGTVDATWCLGDVVGYGPDPNECVARLMELPNLTCILGNHDAAALGRIPLETFNADARRSAQWLHEQVTPQTFRFLSSLPETAEREEVTLAHGSPRNPIWEYILDLHSAAQNLAHFNTPLCLVGHTHLPLMYIQQDDTGDSLIDLRWDLAADGVSNWLTSRAILNPGSVGQPRDHDPRASYAILDLTLATWQLGRVAYDIAAVQQRIRAANLPSRHAARLSEGW